MIVIILPTLIAEGDRVWKESISRRTRFKNILKKVAELKWSWVEHVARQNEDR